MKIAEIRCNSRAALTDKEIAGCFNAYLGRINRVRLIGGAAEPVYLPGLEQGYATIRYTRDYPRSALHELAHWCIAGSQRRDREDYGYWYQPPPRTISQQLAFVDAEIEVQAVECLLAKTCGLPFRVSLDDVDADPEMSAQFEAAVSVRADEIRQGGLPKRAELLVIALGEYVQSTTVSF